MHGALNLDACLYSLRIACFQFDFIDFGDETLKHEPWQHRVIIVSFVLAGPKKPLKDRVEVKGSSGVD